MELSIKKIISFSEVSVDLDRNDSEIEIFTKYFSLIDKDAVMRQMKNASKNKLREKNESKAKTMRNWGNEAYNNKDFDDALQYYNRAVSFAPRNSIEFALCVANRSALLFVSERYEECLKDIEIVLRSEYPIKLLYKIYLRQSQCYIKLNMISTANKCITKAKMLSKEFMSQEELPSWNRKIVKIRKDALRQFESEKSDEVEDFVKNIMMPITPSFEMNPKYLNSSVAVNTTGYPKKSGNNVIANRDVKKGDILFMEEPYAFAFVDQEDVEINICAYCLHKTENFVPCTHCSTHTYCTDKCRYKDWNLGHRWTCYGERTTILKEIEPLTCLSILFQASRDNFETKVEDITVFTKEDNKYAFINKFPTYKDQIDHEELEIFVQHAAWIVLYLKEYTDYFKWLFVQPNRPEGNKEQLYNLVGGNIIKYLMLIKYHARGIRDSYVKYEADLAEVQNVSTGLGIYMSTNLMKHSCFPNTVQSFNGTTKIVRAKTDIKEGEEVTFDYFIVSYKVKDITRQKLELKKRMLTCVCAMCTDSDPQYLESQQPFLCRRCRGKLFRLPNKTTLKCADCLKVCSAKEYLNNDSKISELLIFFEITGDSKSLTTLYNMLKKTYHQHSLRYFTYYNACLAEQLTKSNFKKCLEILKAAADTALNVFGDISEEYIWASISYTNLLAKHTNAINNHQNKNYKKNVDEIKTMLKTCVTVLEYVTSPENIKLYVEVIAGYLKIDFSASEEGMEHYLHLNCLLEEIDN